MTHACDFNFDIFDTHETGRAVCERLTVPFYNCSDHANPPPALGQLNLIYSTSTQKSMLVQKQSNLTFDGLVNIQNEFTKFPKIYCSILESLLCTNKASNSKMLCILRHEKVPNVDIRMQWVREMRCWWTAASSQPRAKARLDTVFAISS